MFTGLIEELGRVETFQAASTGARLRVRGPVVCQDLRAGDSISVNGVCLTAVDSEADSFAADLAPETLRRTTLGELKPGASVNLERCLTPQARLGGHIVQGHVDGVGRIAALEPLGNENWWLRVEVPPELDRYLVYKGSVAINGISLTVAEIADRTLSVTIIPHTYRHTNLHTLSAGSTVNLECDVLAKYVEKLVAALHLPKGLTVEALREQGF